MSIIYSVIAKEQDSQIINLCQYDNAYGNYPTIINQALKNRQPHKKSTYEWHNKQYSLHIMNDDIMIYACLAEYRISNEIVFGFLAEIKRAFKETFSNEEVISANSFDLNIKFAEIYKSQIILFNGSKNDKNAMIKNSLEGVQDILTENIEKLIQKERQINIMIKKTNKINDFTESIKKDAYRIKRQSFLNKNKWKMLIAGIIVSGGAALIIFI